MYSRWLNLNHRVRLTAMLTATVSIALGAVFLMVVLEVRDQAINRRFSDLESTLKRFSQEWKSPDSVRELQEDIPGAAVAVYGLGGELLASSDHNLPARQLGRRRSGDRLILGLSVGSVDIVGTCSWAETQTGVNQLELVLAGLWLPLTILVAAVSWYGGGLVLRPVRELVESAEKLSETREQEVLTTTDRAEFASLASSLNQLLARVRHAAAVQEQFASDAAHELRTPLAILRTRIEANLKRRRTTEEHVASQKAMLVQIERLTAMVEALLSSARQPQSGVEAIDLAAAVETSVKEWAELRDWPAERLRLTLNACVTRLSQSETEIVIRNLMDNAARYSTEASAIEVCVACEDGMASLSIRDYGPGISEEEVGRVFERFYRADAGRNREDGGAGIGLAVVKRIAEAAGGTARFVPVEPGALIQVTVPAQD